MLRSPVRELRPGDGPQLAELCSRDPIANVFVAGRLESQGFDVARLGGQVFGYFDHGELIAACWVGANAVPVQVSANTAPALAAKAARGRRRCWSIVGPSFEVGALWEHLAEHWGPAREVRENQPLMIAEPTTEVVPDDAVRLAQMADLDLITPASVAMFTEEVGYSPVGSDGGYTYRQRVAELVGSGRTFASFTSDASGPRRVIFKADLGAVSSSAIQVQGVWVNPEFRGQGRAAPGMAAVVRHCARLGPQVVSLYVNAYNTRAISAYQRVGFRRIGAFTTVLF